MTSADDRLAAELADRAGQLLLDLRAEAGDPDVLRKAGDRLSHEFLAAELAARRPGDALLSEEGRDDRARLTADRVWIIDPLDGTREFGEPGRTDWAVHVALWERDALTAGAVALPAQGQVLSTAAPPPLPAQSQVFSAAAPPPPRDQGKVVSVALPPFPDQNELSSTAAPPLPAQRTMARPGAAAPREGRLLRPAGAPAGRPLRLVVSRTRPPAFLERLAQTLAVTLVPLGSAGAKAAAVIRGEADAYVHAGGQHEWDSAAPVAVALAAGLYASRLDGSPLVYNQPDPVLPDIMMCPVVLAESLLGVIGAARGPRPE